MQAANASNLMQGILQYNLDQLNKIYLLREGYGNKDAMNLKNTLAQGLAQKGLKVEVFYNGSNYANTDTLIVVPYTLSRLRKSELYDPNDVKAITCFKNDHVTTKKSWLYGNIVTFARDCGINAQ